MKATLEQYKNLLEEHPVKFSEKDVNYREAEDRLRCSRCIHFFERKLDRYGVCEVVITDDTDTGIDPDYVCDLFTHTGTDHPLMADSDEDN